MTTPDGRLRVGVASLVEHPMAELAQRATALEDLGYDDVWVPDERLMRNVYVSLAAVAGATTRVGLGTAVTNPYTRHPTLTAAAIATIDELSGGRATLAMGAGGGLGAYGIDRRSPVQALREATEIVRRLTSGETVTWQGELFDLRGAHLDFPALRPVPVYLAARGPKILQLAGEIADGVIIGGFADERGITYAQDMVSRGLERSGRSAADVDHMAWLYVSASTDPAAARTAVSKQVLASLVTSRPILPELGLDVPQSLLDHLDRTGWAYPVETAEEASALLPDHIVDAFAVHGTPEMCAARLEEIRRCGIDHVCFVLFPAEGDDLSSLAERLAVEVVPQLGTVS
jgi:5,10-methylenetetrahydromethanopterin reductase